MSDCIFCKIASGEVATDMVYENELACAFKDMSPLAPVHVLVVPKAHHDNMLDGVDDKTLGAMLDCVEHVVDIFNIRDSGFRIVTNSGPDSGQAVQHLHWHVLGGRKLSNELG